MSSELSLSLLLRRSAEARFAIVAREELIDASEVAMLSLR